MSKKGNGIRRIFSIRNVIISIVIGLGAIGLLLYQDFDADAFLKIKWNWNSTFWILIAVVMIAIRQLAYMYRIRILTDKELSWRQCFDVIALWEFASAATPTIVGGATAGIFLLAKEKINMGKATAIILCTAFLDVLFFILCAPVFFLLAGKHLIFPNIELASFSIITSIMYLFIIGYIVLLIYTLLVGYGLFINPNGLKRLIIKIFTIRFLRKWRQDALQTGNDVVVASFELQQKKIIYWVKTFGSTIISWIARYFIINCIIVAFFLDVSSLDLHDHFVIYARQIVMWIIMLITPTPGGSGMAEFVFSKLLVEFIPSGLSASLAFLWRILSYYPYLLLGVIILPRWLRRVYSSRNKNNIKK